MSTQGQPAPQQMHTPAEWKRLNSMVTAGNTNIEPSSQKGLLEPGNIDIGHRPIHQNADGSISTLHSMSFEQNGQEILVPLVADDGHMMSNQEAIENYNKTGRHLGKFDNADNATAYARRLWAHQEARSRNGELGVPLPQGGFQNEKDFQDFQSLNPAQQLKYLHATDPDFGKLPVDQQNQYVDSLLGKQAPAEQSFGDKLTAGGSSAGAQAFDAKHPILGKPLRALDAAGGAALGLPGFLYHSVVDPLSPEEQANGQGRLEAIPERLLGGEATAHALQDYGSGKVSARGAASVLPEAIGTGVGTVGATEGLGLAKSGLGRASESTRNEIAQRMRYPATASQSDIGAPGTVKPLPFTPDWLSNGLVPKGRLGSPTNPGRMVGLPKVVGSDVLADEQRGPVGSPNNPGPMSKIPTRVPASVLREEQAAQAPPVEPTYRDATLNKRNIPEFAGEGEATPSPSQSLAPLGARRGRMGPPLRPNIFSSEEAAKIYDSQISRLGAEAKDAGLYSAARGAVKRIPDYQERIGRTLNPYGGEPTSPVDLQDTDLIPRKKTSGQ